MSLETEEISGCQVIHCSENVEGELIAELITKITALMDEPQTASLVIDLKKKSQVDYKFFRALAGLGIRLKKEHKKLHFVQPIDETFQREIREQGLDSILKVHPTLNHFIQERDSAPAPKKPALQADVVFLNAFIDASLKTLSVQCSIEAKAGKVTVLSQAPEMVYDIIGLIGLASKAFQGTIAICYPQETFLKIIGSMLGETYTEISKDLEDGAAELMNIIFGQGKITLNQKGYEIEKAIPTVIRAPALKIRSVSHGATLVIPFESSAGPFRMEISIDRQTP